VVDERELDVLGDAEVVEQRAVLKQHPEAAAHGVELVVIGPAHVGAKTQDLA